jgi:hypothetical protein
MGEGRSRHSRQEQNELAPPETNLFCHTSYLGGLSRWSNSSPGYVSSGICREHVRKWVSEGWSAFTNAGTTPSRGNCGHSTCLFQAAAAPVGLSSGFIVR